MNAYSLWCALSYVFYLNFQCPYYMYDLIHQLSSFQFNSNLMLWWEETYGSVKPQAVEIVLN